MFKPDPRLHQRLPQSVVVLLRVFRNAVLETEVVPIQVLLFGGREGVEVLHEDACKLLRFKLNQGVGVLNY